jgi:hypothetical protein
MFTVRRGLCAATATATVVLALVGAGPDAGAGESASERPTAASVAEVRRATAAYHDPAVALADGFVPTEECSVHPELGGMGLHYVNPGRLMDPAVLATEPEVLLYEPQADGTLRLVGVEWFSVDPDQDASTDAGRPSILGVPFDGPMMGHEPGMPVHFDLHAWIWKQNPAGDFAAWNPTVRCDR